MIEVSSRKQVLVLSAHTDDAELACGGSMARFVSEGARLFCAAFSTCENSLPEGWPPDALECEFREATRVLGIRRENLFVYNYPVRKLSYHRQEVLETLIRLRQEIEPDLVLLPSTGDQHQDHQTLAAEGIRAFRNTQGRATLLGYEMPWNLTEFPAHAFIRVSAAALEAKLQALECYRSQQERPYFSEDFVRALAIVRGMQVGCQYAEAFEVLRVTI
jgi:LmbE family N-acetylglucosaminyl deacetylase